MKKGFTLVELAIVLVIIGLLIGGILVAQSMMESVKVSKFARTVQQYDIAVSNFQTRYKSLPGDSTALNPPGNGDGQIIYLDPVGRFMDDVANFWVHLQQAGFMADQKPFTTVVGTALNSDPANLNTPVISGNLDGGVLPFYSTYAGTNPSVPARPGNYYNMGKWTSGGTGVLGTAIGIFKPSLALAIDTKIDDGKDFTGNVSSNWYAANLVMGRGNCLTNGGAHAVTNNYDLSQTQPNCWLAVKMLSQVNQKE